MTRSNFHIVRELKFSQQFFPVATATCNSTERRSKMNNNRKITRIYGPVRGGIPILATAALLGATVQAHSTIDNTATASGTFTGPGDTVSAGSTVNIPVVPPARDLSIVKTVVGGPTTANGVAGMVDDGDTITYRYVITNTGNVTEDDVIPVDVGPTFNGVNAENALGAFTEVTGGTGDAATLAPGETVFFEATYTLDELDVYRAANITDGVSNSATASSNDHTDADASTAETTIPGTGGLSIAKTSAFTTEITADGLAEVGEIITYTYTVTNTGNVALTNVSVQDDHENGALTPVVDGEDITDPTLFTDNGLTGDSADATPNDGVIDTLGAGDVAVFTYVHTVTQTEVDNQ